ncbi:M-phase inducer phosphatase-like [Achroia grisella]|uniref:M-phase inducer phosphatase-like n=1 Tax=Achroia grisella TaxID=688607 RepID=UPI0027D20E71|nr:M-phase inducer phosphatase-like [Achroia grisella]
MWSEASNNCESNCQCSGLITENFKINSGNSGTKRKQDEALTTNFKIKMSPHSLNFNSPQSPIASASKWRVLGEIQNSPLYRPKVSPVIERLRNSPVLDRLSPQINRHVSSPITSRILKSSTTKISRIFEERSRFKMDKENIGLMSETFVKLEVEEETRDCSFGESFQSTKTSWSTTKLDFTNSIPSKSYEMEKEVKDMFVPENDADLDSDFQTLHDLEEEFDSDNFDHCTKYEIISTDSPNIISRGRSTTARKINSRNFSFGAPLADNEQSTSFNRPNANATRMLNFEDETFEFTSPATKSSSSTSASVKKSLKFTETPTKNPLRHERSDSSIGSMSSISSPASSRLRIFTSESTTSMESGFISELEEPFLDMEDASNSPKMANFNDLLSGQIKDSILTDKNFQRKPLQRSYSLNPQSKARVSLYSILENPEKRSQKRVEKSEMENVVNKRRRTSDAEKVQRPVLQRAYSENNASIMSALARSAVDPDLIGDFSVPFALPLTSGDHSDLKSISCDTLAALLRGDFQDSISDFQVIDCRYPYEFEGGHILGAVNLYTPAQILTMVNKPLQPKDEDSKRSILVFHCEFSLERGPKLSRFLRSSDRAKNMENYPSLHYPEVYLLHEGYRSFYQRHPQLCTPEGYTAMLDPKHKQLLKQHRSTPSQTRLQRLL